MSNVALPRFLFSFIPFFVFAISVSLVDAAAGQGLAANRFSTTTKNTSIFRSVNCECNENRLHSTGKQNESYWQSNIFHPPFVSVINSDEPCWMTQCHADSWFQLCFVTVEIEKLLQSWCFYGLWLTERKQLIFRHGKQIRSYVCTKSTCII